jgi:integrase
MASVVKRTNSRYFYASYRIPVNDGGSENRWKQVMKCTKHVDRAKALRAALAMEDSALREAGAGEEGGKRIMAILTEAGQKAAQKRLTLDMGREYLRRLVESSVGDALKTWSARAWLNEWLQLKTATTKTATQARYRLSIASFLTFLGQTADAPLEQLTVQNLRMFRDKLRAEGRVAKTVNGYLKDVGAGLNAAVREGILVRSPGSNLEFLHETDSIKRETFSLDEISKLIQAAPSADWRGVIFLGAFGGLRLGDAARLKSHSVNLVEKVITFVPEKSNRRAGSQILLPMHPELLRFFRTHLKAIPVGPCFPSLCFVSVAGNRGLSATFVEIMRQAAISRGKSRTTVEGSAGRPNHSRSFHSLRHTFNSLLLNKGVSQETRQKLVGHTDERVNAGYSHHDVETLRVAVNTVPNLSHGRKK